MYGEVSKTYKKKPARWPTSTFGARWPTHTQTRHEGRQHINGTKADTPGAFTFSPARDGDDGVDERRCAGTTEWTNVVDEWRERSSPPPPFSFFFLLLLLLPPSSLLLLLLPPRPPSPSSSSLHLLLPSPSSFSLLLLLPPPFSSSPSLSPLLLLSTGTAGPGAGRRGRAPPPLCRDGRAGGRAPRPGSSSSLQGPGAGPAVEGRSGAGASPV